jgi:hypothetical protein
MTCFLFASWHLIVSTGIFSFVFMLTSHFRLFFKKPDNLRKGTLTSIPPLYYYYVVVVVVVKCVQSDGYEPLLYLRKHISKLDVSVSFSFCVSVM